MVTLKDLARMCDVSPSTVSNILNGKSNVSEETRRRVLDKIEETGYRRNFFASSIRRNSTQIIAVITEDLAQFSTTTIVEFLMARCEDLGYRTVLMNMRMYDRWQDTWYDDDEKLEQVLHPMLQEMQSIKVDGVVYVAGHDREINCFPRDYHIPTVIAYGRSGDLRFPSILIDDEKGGYDVARYIIGQGHRNIGVITGREDNLHTIHRLRGFQRALFEAGIPYNPAWVKSGDWEMHAACSAAEELLRDPALTVLWAMSDRMAAGVYQYLGTQTAKKVSICGYDDMEFAEFMIPELTTNRLPLREIGLRAAEEIVRIIDQGMPAAPCERILMPCNLVIRRSVECLSAS
ncbi:MAG: LacI family DNA-binding transcriptional regulator [Butyrivibrio sp.]|nr:LacI family DNA-binding transcriptional regulator [Butyrivibrio sp.]